jgi:hypothetical protein
VRHLQGIVATLSFVLLFVLAFSACGLKTAGSVAGGAAAGDGTGIPSPGIFRIAEQLILYPASVLIPDDNHPEVPVDPENPPTDPPVDPGTPVTPTDPGTTPTTPTDPTTPSNPPIIGGNIPATPVVITPKAPTPTPVADARPNDLKVNIRRACWDRPKDWPVLNRLDKNIDLLLKDPSGKTLLKWTFDGDDFHKKTQSFKITSSALYQANKNLLLNASTHLELCSRDSKGVCKDITNDDDTFHSGLFLIRKGSVNFDKTYEWCEAPFRPDSAMSLKGASSELTIEVLIENIGQYQNVRGNNERDLVKKEYCDVVYKATSPLSLDFSGRGFLPRSQSDGFFFDLDADSALERVSSLGPDAGILVYDRNKNGTIDNGTELFGDATPLVSGVNAADGFAALKQHNLNGDDVIDSKDAIYSELRIWRDLNNNGVMDDDEFLSLAESGVSALNLNEQSTMDTDIFGNQVRQLSTWKGADGSSKMLADIWFMTVSEVN